MPGPGAPEQHHRPPLRARVALYVAIICAVLYAALLGAAIAALLGAGR